jgi:hypothetical protein
MKAILVFASSCKRLPYLKLLPTEDGCIERVFLRRTPDFVFKFFIFLYEYNCFIYKARQKACFKEIPYVQQRAHIISLESSPSELYISG